ncbi:MAG: hypothetical protein KAW67_08880 [Candidatus Eisenbacteria sp.]|nr:hypothetical protein [Candidatus Eisenbacteria bacterium]
MTRTLSILVAAVAILTVSATTASPLQADDALTNMELDILRVCEGVIQLFASHAADIWPGYDLSERPFLVYIPDRWALLMNCGDGAEGFGPPPRNWPDVGAEVCFKEGQVGNLVGQLAFGYDAGGVRTVAVGFPESMSESFEDLELKMLAYVVHEAFHEYQDEVFGDIEWAREQEYPIEDVENAALAYLEMALLVDAVEAAWADDAGLASEATAQFVAVRAHRWARADSFIATYEGGKETREGTARYVELRCLDFARVLDYESSVRDAPPLMDDLAHAALPGYLLDDFRDSMRDGAIPVEDLPRNRIYAVASAQGFLLDYFDVDWQPEAERSTLDFTYASLLGERLGLSQEDHAALIESAKARHGYPELLAAAGRSIESHLAAYREASAVFEQQQGTRIEIAFDTNGLYRSRATSATRLVVDRGAHELCHRYDVYTLERDGTFFELHDAGLLEVNDYDAYRKTVVFYAPSVDTVTVDGDASAAPASTASVTDEHGAEGRHFTALRIVGDGFELTHDGPGTITVGASGMVVDLTAK